MNSVTLTKKSTVLILLGAMLGILLAALDSNIVGTAMPKIIASLNGFDLYAWPISAYLLTMTVSMPIFGKLSDTVGFKPVYVFGFIDFVIGSALCGISQTMPQLIIFRALQGLGGAILLSNTLAIVNILFPPAQRAKYGGYVSSASGLASLVGPFIGGLIADHASWRWVFFINLPLGAAALVVILFALPSVKPERRGSRIDFAGALALVAVLVPLLLAFTWGGKNYGWGSPVIVLLFVLSALMLLVFGLRERKAADPIIPPLLFKKSVFNFTAVIFFLMNSVLMACIVFIPLYLQGVKGVTASSSGAIITPMLVSLIGGVIFSGSIVSKTCRYKRLALLGFVMMAIAAVLLTQNLSYGAIIAAMLIMGIGIGVCMAIFNVTAQNVFPTSRMGVVTSSVQFFGRLGQTISAALFASVLSGAVLADAIRVIFTVCAATVLLAIVLTLLMKEVPLKKTTPSEDGE